MSNAEEQVKVFRCKWNWFRVVSIVSSWMAAAVFFAVLVAVLYNVALRELQMHRLSLSFPEAGFTAQSLWIILLMVVLSVAGIWMALLNTKDTCREVRNWRADITPEVLRITDKHGNTQEVAWDDIHSLTFLAMPELRTAQGKIRFPDGIINGRRLFALIVERATLTQTKGSWVTGITLSRPVPK